jgi:hypothetical protein
VVDKSQRVGHTHAGTVRGMYDRMDLVQEVGEGDATPVGNWSWMIGTLVLPGVVESDRSERNGS